MWHRYQDLRRREQPTIHHFLVDSDGPQRYVGKAGAHGLSSGIHWLSLHATRRHHGSECHIHHYVQSPEQLSESRNFDAQGSLAWTAQAVH